jgi:hypothetical protein
MAGDKRRRAVDADAAVVQGAPATELPPEPPTCSEPAIWHVRFVQAVVLRNWIDAVACVLAEAPVEIHKSEAFSGLSLQHMDATRCCMVQARLCGTVTADGAAEGVVATVTLRLGLVLSCLRASRSQDFAELYQPRENTGTVILTTFEPSFTGLSPRFELSTLQADQEPLRLGALNYDHLIELDLTAFRSAVKMAKDHKADALRILLARHKTSEATMFFAMSFRGLDIRANYCYNAVRLGEDAIEPGAPADSPKVIRAAETTRSTYFTMPPEEELDVLYSASYGLDHLTSFARVLERSTVFLRLRQDQPLVVSVPLGGPGLEYVSFFLAPRL